MAYGNSIAGLVTRWGLAWGIQWLWRYLWHGFLQSNCAFTILQQAIPSEGTSFELTHLAITFIGKMRQSISEHSLVHEAPPHLKACAEWPWEYSILLNLKDPEVWSLRSGEFWSKSCIQETQWCTLLWQRFALLLKTIGSLLSSVLRIFHIVYSLSWMFPQIVMKIVT